MEVALLSKITVSARPWNLTQPIQLITHTTRFEFPTLPLLRQAMRRLLYLHALFFFMPQWGIPLTRASDASFLSDTLVRKDQLQHVLEHEPAQSASCEKTVRPCLSCLSANRSEHCSAAYRSHRDYTMRLRDCRERKQCAL